jgi:hypothetical protein
MPRFSILLCAGLVLAGCGEQPPANASGDEPMPSPEIFAGLPVLPGARMVAGTSSAAEAVVSVPVSADSVARFYRAIFGQRDWAIRGDATAPDGVVTLHAASPEGRPVWIMIRPVSSTSAQVSLIASVPAPAAPDTAQRH